MIQILVIRKSRYFQARNYFDKGYTKLRHEAFWDGSKELNSNLNKVVSTFNILNVILFKPGAYISKLFLTESHSWIHVSFYYMFHWGLAHFKLIIEKCYRLLNSVIRQIDSVWKQCSIWADVSRFLMACTV